MREELASGPRTRPDPPPTATLPIVMHIGVVGDHPGGMAQVVNEYLSWSYSRCRVVGVLSTTGRGDRLSALRSVNCLYRLVRARASRTPHVVVVHLSQRGSFLREGSLLRFAGAIGLPAGAHLHGSEFAGFARSRPRLVSRVLASARVVFSLTDETDEVVRRLFDASHPSRRTRVVRVLNAVAVPAEVPEKEKFVFMAGELGRRKGTDVLLAAWDAVAPRHPDWSLRLAGPLSDGIVVDAARPGVVPMGTVPRAEVLRVQGLAAIAVLPSRHEALPMFLIESMARECATIGTPVGQVRELVADAGLIVPAGDVPALADALDRLMADPDERRVLGRRARQRIEGAYSEAAVSRGLETEWLRMLAREEAEKPRNRGSSW